MTFRAASRYNSMPDQIVSRFKTYGVRTSTQI